MKHMVTESSELLDASDVEIEEALQHADPIVLRGLLFQLTGDEELRDIELGHHLISGYLDVYQVAKPEDAAMIRGKAAAFLKQYRDAGAGPIDIGPRERLLESLSLTAGVPVTPTELPMWLETLGIDPWARGLSWSGDAAPEAAADFSVIVIGAGMGGLNAALHLKNAGVSFRVLEKGDNVGGTWRDNRYPGARLDSPSRLYTHVFGVGYPYPNLYTPGETNQGYLEWIADEFDLRGSVELHSEVTSLAWDDATSEWVVSVTQNGRPQVLRANAVVSAVGFLSQPSIPRIPGLEDFAGDAFHTARWPEGYSLQGKRVAVIGTGCTGYQMIPEIAREAAHLSIFQRTPNWLFEAPGYLKPFPEQVKWLDRNFPFLTNFERFQLAFLQRADMTGRRLKRDAGYQDEHAVSETNRITRDNLIASLERKLAGHPDLIEKMTPTAPPMAARPVLFDPEYSVLDVLLHDDVSLVSEGIERVRENGIETKDGVLHELDTIVLATGFRANDYLWPMEVRGRGGITLEEAWSKDGARAYLGSLVPGFPNLFMIYGPNTNLTVGFQILDMIELTARFALENIGALIEQGKRSVEVTEDAYWRYNDEIDRQEPDMIYTDQRARNYYINKHGRSSSNNPLDTRVLWNWLRDPAGRLKSDAPVSLAPELADAYRVLEPRHGADLVVR
ncbi:flavin-containing monooxygenase [Microbacterium sp. No. 7]|uniref:flavin-containing monooxygenase n=1 Tax=Microbacterium sp. No. 7 TaxID=1714373 RepID=UPI000A8476EE|nr:NAD(P)/FAD-dependent oxidoreductase [Microbacterium sp. No. 7]